MKEVKLSDRHLAMALEAGDWSGVSVGGKALIAAAIDTLTAKNPDHAMTNQTIDGVPREDLELVLIHGCSTTESNEAWDRLRALLDAPAETVAGHHPACRAVDDYKPGDCSHRCRPAVHPQPDPVLCKFYDVTDWPGLVRELVGHVDLLQDSAKRNVKPWEDTFPPTLLPAYIERVNTANAAAHPQGEPVAFTAVGVLRDDGDGGLEPEWILEGGTAELWAGAVLLIADEDQELCAEDGHCELYRKQPAPVAEVLAEAREWLGDGKHADGLAREHWTPEYAALIDRIDATLRK